MPAPSGQIPPPWAWWEIEAPATRAARRPVPGSDLECLRSGWVGSSDQRGALGDLDRAEHFPSVLVQHWVGVLVHNDVHRPAVDGEYGVAVAVDEVLAGPASLLGRRVQRDSESPRAPGFPPMWIVAERVGCQLERVPRRSLSGRALDRSLWAPRLTGSRRAGGAVAQALYGRTSTREKG